MNSFKPVSNRPNFNQIESEIIKFWQTNKIFEKSIELRESAEEFVFFEGPPTANGKPGVHHVLARTFKDLVCRYQTMKGKKVVRNAGWDEHGLPVEIEVEKSQGFTNERSKKEQIEELGIERFNELCAKSTKKYIDEWEKLTERMAYWVNFDNAYKTSSPQYIEKVWSILKSLNDKNLLYKGNKVVPWACDSGTVVSQAEVAQGYKDVVDESAYVKFKLTESATKSLKEKFGISAEDESPIYMLAWTTTPWTLPSNMALAISPDIEYVICKRRSTTPSSVIKEEEQSNIKSPLSELEAEAGMKSEKLWQTGGDLWEKLKPLAQQMRKEPTEAENALWQALRDKKLKEFKFRRQHSIDRFIADFYCPESKLIIEVDGNIHDYTQEEDQLRQEFLESLGYKVIRFTNEEVLNDLNNVISRIETYLTPSPNPFPASKEGEHSNIKSPLSEFGEGLGVRSEYIIISQKRWKAVLEETNWEVAGGLKGWQIIGESRSGIVKVKRDSSGEVVLEFVNGETISFELTGHGNRNTLLDTEWEIDWEAVTFYHESTPGTTITVNGIEEASKMEIPLKSIQDSNTKREVKIPNKLNGTIYRQYLKNFLGANTFYESLFDNQKACQIISGENPKTKECFVEDSETSGTGIVHIAPAFGQDDFEARKFNGIEDNIICAVSPNGVFNEQAPDFLKGQSIFNDNKKTGLQEFIRINKVVCNKLTEKGLLLKTEKYEHSYPHNWRTNNPLIYYLRPSWYVATSKVREQLIEANKNINWYPEHIKEGRFGQWLENNIDWSISRERFWGTPLPIWVNENTGQIQVIGSFDELEEKINQFNPSQKDLLEKIKQNPHKPLIDQLEWEEDAEKLIGDFKFASQKEKFKRVPEVLDCWFDSGSMPVAAYGTEPENFKTADYICEAIDQTRGWFYSLLAIAVSLSSETNNLRSPYKNVLCLGHILDKDGQKMSKSKGNVLNPWDLFEKYGADPVRWYMISAVSAGQPIRFDIDGIAEVMRRFILPLWNTYAFFILYANLDKITNQALQEVTEEQLKQQVQPIDIWITARLNQTQKQINEEFEKFEFAKVAQLIEKFVNDLSNVWVRSNRSRFWNIGNSLDYSAYLTLHTCLVAVAKMSAPFSPLISEEIYQNLKSADSPESIHLGNWVEADELSEFENNLLKQMEAALEIINIGRSLRQEAKIKIRQPLAQIFVSDEFDVQYFADLILQELNIKELLVIPASELENNLKAQLNTEINPTLKAEGLAREFIHSVQNLRKSSGFEVSDRIELQIDFMNNHELAELIRPKKEYIMNEVLALAWLEDVNVNLEGKKIKLDGFEINLLISKVNY